MQAKRLLYHPALRTIVRLAREEDLRLYLVGGAVRARLLFPENEVQNVDLLLLGEARTFATKAAAALHSRPVIIKPQFDTTLIPVPGMEFEISGPRTLSRTGPDTPPLPPDPLIRDLLLRDFTINALAEPLAPALGPFVDPTNGREDLQKRLIRTPLDPRITLTEDPSRLLRAIRFATELHFSLAPELLAALHETRQLLQNVSTERLTAELIKILMSPQPSVGLKLLYVTGLLEVGYPDLAALANLSPGRTHRHKDVFEHTLKVVDAVAESGARLETRLAALLHDVGKPATRRFDAELGWTFHGHEVLGERLARRLTKSWRLPGEVTDKVAKLVRLHMRPINLTDEGVTDSALRRLGVQAGEEVDDLLTLCRADVTSADPNRVKRYLENFERVVELLRTVQDKDELAKFQSPVHGEVIMAETGLEPGPLIGKLKTMIEEAILDGVIPNDYEAALDYLRKINVAVLKAASLAPE